MNTFYSKDKDELKPLLDMVRKGRLFDVQKWITEGKPLLYTLSYQKNALFEAIDEGFHSMVQVLLEVWVDQESLDDAMNYAANRRRPDLVWLVLDRKPNLAKVDLDSVAKCCNKELMKFFLDRWEEIKQPHGLFDIVLARMYPLIGLIREYAHKIPNSNLQLASALKQYIHTEDPKWVSLTIWMGADPRLKAPGPYDDEDTDVPVKSQAANG